MLIQPTLQRVVLQAGLLLSFLVYLVSIHFVPRFNKFSIYHFYCYFYVHRHWCSYNEPFVSFYNVFYFKIQHICIVSLRHLVNRGFLESSMRNVVNLELIICRRPILFEHNCTSPPLLTPRLKIFKWKFTTSPGIEPRTRWTWGRHATIWASAASIISCQQHMVFPSGHPSKY